MNGRTELVTIGQIVKAHGVHGAMRIRSLSDVPGRFEGLSEVTLVTQAGREVPAKVTQVRKAGDAYLLTVEAVTSPEAAAPFRGGFVKIRRDEAAAPAEGPYYEYQLIGLTVTDESGRSLGVIEEILDTPANPVFVVRQGAEELLIPATKAVVDRIDQQRQTMTVRLPEGLAEATRGAGREV
jgi:16S rRNA processing protein RimM